MAYSTTSTEAGHKSSQTDGRSRSDSAGSGAVSGRLAETAPAGAPPPFANRGVATTGVAFLKQKCRSLISTEIDWLTVTVASESVPQGAGAYLLAVTDQPEAGSSRPGFESSEQRRCIGGQCWRMMAPRQSSKRFGSEYETWEFSGPSASSIAPRLRGKDVRARRIDVAFDFSVDDAFLSDDVIEALRDQIEGRGLSIGISGQNEINTRYIGGAKSDRRVRIYRKDLQDDSIREFFGPVMRIELVLRGDEAERLWQVWNRFGREMGVVAAAGVVGAMTGWQPVEGDMELPSLEMPECKDVAGQLALFVKQNGAMLRACDEAGLDVMRIAQDHAPHVHRSTRFRERRRVQEIIDAGVNEVETLCRRLLRSNQFGEVD